MQTCGEEDDGELVYVAVTCAYFAGAGQSRLVVGTAVGTRQTTSLLHKSMQSTSSPFIGRYSPAIIDNDGCIERV